MGTGKGERLKTCERPEDSYCGKQALLLCPADFGPYITFIFLCNASSVSIQEESLLPDSCSTEPPLQRWEPRFPPPGSQGPNPPLPPLHRRSDWDKVHGPLQYRSGPVLYYRGGAQGGEQEQGLLRLGLPGQGLPGISKPTSETPLQEPGARKNNVEEVSGVP